MRCESLEQVPSEAYSQGTVSEERSEDRARQGCAGKGAGFARPCPRNRSRFYTVSTFFNCSQRKEVQK